MNLAIEYLKRNNRFHNLLNFPCSFFLDNKNGKKMVVSLHNCYGDKNTVIVRHWNLREDKAENRLPTTVEYRISRKDIFKSPYTIIKGYELLEYIQEPYVAGFRQYSDHPRANEQQNEYESCLNTFFNTKSHMEKKLNWLWDAFEEIHVPEDLQYMPFYEVNCKKEVQREIIQVYAKSIWNKWLYWRKHLLDFNYWIATELIFHFEYNTSIEEKKLIEHPYYGNVALLRTTPTLLDWIAFNRRILSNQEN